MVISHYIITILNICRTLALGESSPLDAEAMDTASTQSIETENAQSCAESNYSYVSYTI